MELFNTSLLGKWKWRLLVEETSVWHDLIQYLYGDSGVLNNKHHSTWWNDLKQLDSNLSFAIGWFQDCIKCKIGNGRLLNFWNDQWCSQWPLKKLFSDVFAVSDRPDGRVADFREWENGVWHWRFTWSRTLTATEQNAKELLLNTLAPIVLDQNCNDRWIWLLDNSSYKVKSVYNLLLSKSGEEPAEELLMQALKKVWKAKAPSKYLVHSWRTLQNKIPTRAAFVQRGILDFNDRT